MAWHTDRTHVVGEIIQFRRVVLRIVATDDDGSIYAESPRGAVVKIEPAETNLIQSVDRKLAALFEEFYNPYPNASARRLQRVLDLWSKLLPARVVSEDLGDYRETIDSLFRAGKFLTGAWTAFKALGATGVNSVVYVFKPAATTPSVVIRGSSSTLRRFKMPDMVVVIPVRCEKCEANYDIECAHSSGFGYMQSTSFRCEACGHVNKLDAVPSEPLRVLPHSVN